MCQTPPPPLLRRGAGSKRRAMADADPSRRPSGALPLPDRVALVLQGGGALGSFQAGVYEALAASAIGIDWVAGISIGAVNAALIAGNPPERRVERLAACWDRLTSALPSVPLFPGRRMRELVQEWSAAMVAGFGVPGFFHPRPLPPALAAPGTPAALSFYDSSQLAATLDAFVDWELLNHGPIRVSVGAVDIASGNFRYFDSASERLDARHIMASGALPPGLPPIEIDGRLWWDGGLVSNTPLSHVLDNQTDDLLVFQVDLFPSEAAPPRTIMDVMAREKEIRFSSRTRLVTDGLIARRREREAIRKVLAKLPEALKDDADVVALAGLAREHAVNVVHLIYRASAWEGGTRDYEFSARARAEHWAAGKAAVEASIDHSGLLATNILDGGTAAFDLARR